MKPSGHRFVKARSDDNLPALHINPARTAQTRTSGSTDNRPAATENHLDASRDVANETEGGMVVESLLYPNYPLKPVRERAEIDQAFADYRRTGFCGWPWDTPDPVHGGNPERFARHADGRVEQPESTMEPRQFGWWAGQVTIEPDFDELPDEIREAFGMN